MISRRDNGDGDRGGRVDTSKIEARLRAELAEIIELGQAAISEGREADAMWFLAYATALYGLITSDWGLMTIAFQELDL